MLQVLGIIGALDPHTHKVNQANIQGEGKLEAEGVRPQRQADPIGGLGAGAADTLGALPACSAQLFSVASVVALSKAQDMPTGVYCKCSV